MAAMTGRVAALERCKPRFRFSPDGCPGPATALVEEGEEPPADAARCRLCGGLHVLVVVVEVVDTAGGEA
jgi:hypothetical protein